MKYKAYLIQRGEGCDYYIGCAQTVINLTSDNMEDAIKELEDIIDEQYSYEDVMLEKVELYEINEIKNFNINKFYAERDKRLKKKQNDEDKIARFAEYQKLQKEFSKK